MRPLGRAQLWALAALLAGCAEQVSPNRVESVLISTPSTAPLLVGPGGGQTRQLSAAALNASGDPVPSIVAWSVTTPSVIAVAPTGIVTALAAGAGRVVATVGKRADSLDVLVQNVPAASVTLSPAPLGLEISAFGAGTQQLGAVVRDSTGATLLGRVVTWSSSNPGVASVSGTGLVTAIAVGSAYARAAVEGRMDSVLVTVTGTTGFPAGVDLQIVGAQWTQAAQNAAGTIPVLRLSRAAVVNVITSTNSGLPSPGEYALRLFDSGGTLLYADTVGLSTPAAPTAYSQPTAQFLVPSSFLQPGVRWEVVRDPRGVAPDADAANDRFPRGAHAAVNLITAPLLRLRFVPVSLSNHGGVTGNVSGANIDQYLEFLRAVIPYSEVEVTVAAPFSFSGSFGTAPQGGSSAFWVPLIQAIDAARVADVPNQDAHWIGVVAPPAGFNFVTNGGWGFIPPNGGYTGPNSRTFALVNVGWFANTAATRQLVVHELGHNLGRQHAPCGVAGADPTYPRADGTIGPGGHNTYAWEQGLTSSALPVAESVGDVMSYCANPWVSAYTYDAMLTFRGSIGSAVRAPSVIERVLLVQGEEESGDVRVTNAAVIRAEAGGTDAFGAWSLQGLDAAGRVLFTHRFALGRWDHSATRRPFGLTVPLTEAVEAQLTTLRVSGPTGAGDLRLAR